MVKQVIEALISMRISKLNANKFRDYVLCSMFLNRSNLEWLLHFE